MDQATWNNLQITLLGLLQQQGLVPTESVAVASTSVPMISSVALTDETIVEEPEHVTPIDNEKEKETVDEEELDEGIDQ